MVEQLHTPRLRLELLRPSHFWLLKSVLQDEEIMRYSAQGVKSDAEIVDYIEESRGDARYGGGQYAVFHRQTGRFLGVAGYFFFYLDGREELEINYRLLRQARGAGHAAEVASMLAERGLAVPGRSRVYGIVDVRNTASQRVLENAGLRPLGEYAYHGRTTLLYVREAAVPKRHMEDKSDK